MRPKNKKAGQDSKTQAEEISHDTASSYRKEKYHHNLGPTKLRPANLSKEFYCYNLMLSKVLKRAHLGFGTKNQLWWHY